MFGCVLRIALKLMLLTTLLLSTGCNKPDPNTIIVGTISGPETELMKTAQTVAFKRYGLKIKIIEFNDYNLPNEALMDGSLDANVYQHRPYLNAAKAAHGYQFDVIGKTFVYPTGLYSTRIKTLEQLPKNAWIALPNDPSNASRALLLLQQAHLITLKKATLFTLNDVLENPKHLRFKELDAAQLPRVLADVDAAIINTTFAIPAGLQPTRDALIIENKDSPYANLIVVRHDHATAQQLRWLVEALHSDEVKKTAKTLFGDAAIAAW